MSRVENLDQAVVDPWELLQVTAREFLDRYPQGTPAVTLSPALSLIFRLTSNSCIAATISYP